MIMSEKQDPENRKETPTPSPSLPPGVAGTCRKKATIFPVPSFRGQAAENPRLSSCVSPRAAEMPAPVGHRPASPPGFSTSCFSRKIPTWKHLPALHLLPRCRMPQSREGAVTWCLVQVHLNAARHATATVEFIFIRLT
jgi:hypothetical protein